MLNYEELLLAVLSNPPDENEPLPASNQRGTIYGIALTFLILAWTAVLFRLWVRVKVVREPGWDDVFVLLAMISCTTATIFVCLSVEHGLGHHMLYLKLPDISKFIKYFWIEHSLYIMETTLVKVSLLLQFLRIFKAGAMRWTCITLLVLVSLWGLGFSIVAWFPCFPVRGMWDHTINAKCYGFGFRKTQEFVEMFIAHSASNMAFDIAIFMTPLVLFGRANLKSKNLLAMAGVFTFGATVVATSVWRLYSITAHQAATYPYLDFTWWSPLMIILSCIEIDLAIMCASMPIFWPIIEQRFAAIFVSYEINITAERIDDYGLAYELEHTKGGREGSVKSSCGTSMEGLTKEEEAAKAPKFSIGVDPFSDEVRCGNGFQTSVQTQAKDKWRI